ncbi:MAG: hypothetical protein ABI882_18060, partial [Acidobacteriota bacterium]
MSSRTDRPSDRKILAQPLLTTISFIKRHQRVTGVGLILAVMIALTVVGVPYWRHRQEVARDHRIRQALKENAQTVRFVENKGQVSNKDVLYYFDSKQGSVYVESNRIRFVAYETEGGEAAAREAHEAAEREEGQEAEEREAKGRSGHQKNFQHHGSQRPLPRKNSHAFTLNLEGSNPSPKVRQGENFATRYNYILGSDSKKWVTGVQATKELTLESVYQGVDLRLYSTGDGSLEFDWVMAPGADYSKVKMHFSGQDKLALAEDGGLNVGLRFTDVKFHLPESYQVTDKGKHNISFSFNQADQDTITFATDAKLDARYPLVIDPVLGWGTFFDGNVGTAPNTGVFDEYLFAIQVDPVTNIVYCAGATNVNIPTTIAPYDADGYKNTIAGINGGSNTGEAVALIYRISADGTDLLDMTLYGPDTINNNEELNAYALSLSNNRVFVGGWTEVDVPLTADAFDTLREDNEGFVAVFPKDLGTLVYATYIGAPGNDDGVYSIRAIDDSSFVIGANVAATLPAAYISAGAADGAALGTEGYIGKFTTLSTLNFGTYVGGSANELVNDIEILADNSIVFIGTTNSAITEVNSAATSGALDDVLLGVLNSTGTAFTYLDKFGGAGDDRGYDTDSFNGKIYFTGVGGTGFPTSSDAFDTTFSGTSNAIVGAVDVTGGSANFKATYYGGNNATLGNSLKLLTSSPCFTGSFANPIVMVFGSSSSTDLITRNVNLEAFYDGSNNGGLDVIFGGFTSDMRQLIYATYMGGTDNDYLGDTGVPRGANNLWYDGVSNLFVGTTTHSLTHSPTLASGGF